MPLEMEVRLLLLTYVVNQGHHPPQQNGWVNLWGAKCDLSVINVKKEGSMFVVSVPSYRLLRELCTTSWLLLSCRFLCALMAGLLDGASASKRTATTCNHLFLRETELNFQLKQFKTCSFLTPNHKIYILNCYC